MKEKIKLYKHPTKEDIEQYINKKERAMIITTLVVGGSIALIILIFAIVAFIMADQYTFKNVGILLVVIAMNTIIGWKLYNTINIRFGYFMAKVKKITDVTDEYEKLESEKKGEMIELKIVCEFPDLETNLQKSNFLLLFHKEMVKEVEKYIPSVGTEIPIIYDMKKGKILNIFIPELREYITGV